MAKLPDNDFVEVKGNLTGFPIIPEGSMLVGLDEGGTSWAMPPDDAARHTRIYYTQEYLLVARDAQARRWRLIRARAHGTH